MLFSNLSPHVILFCFFFFFCQNKKISDRSKQSLLHQGIEMQVKDLATAESTKPARFLTWANVSEHDVNNPLTTLFELLNFLNGVGA